jgi:thymidine kinase
MFLEPVHNKGGNAGWIEVICGSMFSGKTEELIRRLRRAEIAGQKVKVFKPRIDTRYDKNKVVSHDSRQLQSVPVSGAAEIPGLLKDLEIRVVGIDEAQFFDKELPAVCRDLAGSGFRVIVAGLDMDFKGEPFGPVPAIMAMSEYVTKVHAICIRCGAPASFSHRIAEDETLVLLGEKSHYEPLCRSCFNEAEKKSQ